MSKKKRNEELELEQAPQQEGRKERPPRNRIDVDKTTMSFKAWFINKLNSDGRLKPHHFDQLLIYMNGLGIKSEDAVSRFEMGLRTYFGE